MDMIKTFRYEFKYHINYNEMCRLVKELSQLLDYDQSNKGYLVRSLYFDSINDIDLMDKQSGILERKKIRIRIYDPMNSVIKLEIKQKYDKHQLKESLIISKEMAQELIQGNYSSLLSLNNDVANKIYLIMQTNCYRPKCIVEYNRLAFKTNSKTRVTFDYNIKKTDNVTCLFNNNINYLGLTNSNNITLEIKYDSFLEEYVGSVLRRYITLNDSISKYELARKE